MLLYIVGVADAVMDQTARKKGCRLGSGGAFLALSGTGV